jgi:hypothetical protein
LPERTTPLLTDTLMLEADVAGVLTPFKIPLSGLPINVLGKCQWVDGTNGNDAIGRPFKTITAAKAAAASGETIVVGPGTYDEYDLLKNGVNYFFMPGAVVHYTGGASLASIFTDTAGAVTSTIGGYGVFKTTGTDSEGTVVWLTNDNSDLTLHFDYIYATTAFAIIEAGGKFRMFGNKLESTGGAMLITSGPANSQILQCNEIVGAIRFDGGDRVLKVNNLVGNIVMVLGILEYYGNKITGQVQVNGGEGEAALVLHGVTIVNATPITLEGTTALTLNGCLLKASGDNSMTATGSHDVKVYGLTIASKAAGAGVTFSVGGTRFEVDAGI